MNSALEMSLIIPVYKNESTLPALLAALNGLQAQLSAQLEVVFVVDGSPDASHEYLSENLRQCKFKSQLLILSRNFGAFPAVRAGLAAASGPYYAVMAADLQEPISLMQEFYQELSTNGADVVVGARRTRVDSLRVKFFAGFAWYLYRKFVIPDIPPGGFDVFGCNQEFRNELLKLRESNSSLVGLVYWLGFRRKVILYDRLERQSGKSGWTFAKSLRYFLDSCFSFSDIPVRLLTVSGFLGLALATTLGVSIVFGRLWYGLGVPGYAATATLILFFGSLNCFGLGVIGEYVWRTYENTKARPEAIVLSREKYSQFE